MSAEFNDIHDKAVDRIRAVRNDPAALAEEVEHWLNAVRLYPVDDPVACIVEIAEAINGHTE